MFKYKSSLPIIENAEATMATINFIFFGLSSDIIAALKNKDCKWVSAEISRMCQGGIASLYYDWICLALVSYLAQKAFKLFLNCLLAFKQICWWDQKVKISGFSGQIENLAPVTWIAWWPHWQELKPDCLFLQKASSPVCYSPVLSYFKQPHHPVPPRL